MAAAEGGGAGGGRRDPPHTLQGLLEMAVVAGEAQPEQPREPMGEEVRGDRGISGALWGSRGHPEGVGGHQR